MQICHILSYNFGYTSWIQVRNDCNVETQLDRQLYWIECVKKLYGKDKTVEDTLFYDNDFKIFVDLLARVISHCANGKYFINNSAKFENAFRMLSRTDLYKENVLEIIADWWYQRICKPYQRLKFRTNIFNQIDWTIKMRKDTFWNGI